MIALAGCIACTEPQEARVEIVTRPADAALEEVRLAPLEVGTHTNLEVARFQLQGFLSKQRVDGAATAVRDAQFYPAPAGFEWAALESGVEVDNSTIISGERLALVRVDPKFVLPLTEFRILGEESDERGSRVMRMRPQPAARARFDALCQQAAQSQLLFVARGRVLLAIDVRAPVAGDFWLSDLPERGVSPFVDRIARAAEVPR